MPDCGRIINLTTQKLGGISVMRYAVTGSVEATGERVTREVVCNNEDEARAYAALEGMTVESVTPLVLESSKQKPNPKPETQPRASAPDEKRVYRAVGSVWTYLVLAAAIVAGGVYFGATWHWALMAPFIVVLVVAGLASRRASLTITADAVIHRAAFGRPKVMSFYHIRSVVTQTDRNGAILAITLVLADGTQYWIREIDNLHAVAVDIASRIR